MPWVTLAPADFIATLEKSGEVEIKAALARGDQWIVHEGRALVAKMWLKSKDVEREQNAAIRVELRSEREIAASTKANELAAQSNVLAAEANRVSIEANVIARRAERWAMWAAAIAIIAAMVSAKDLIHDLLIRISN